MGIINACGIVYDTPLAIPKGIAITTILTILSPQEQRGFDAPPKFTADERVLYFSLNNKELEVVQTLRSVTNKIGFILQLGYFKFHAKFYTVEQFRQADIAYVAHSLGIAEDRIHLSSYKKKIPHDHQQQILKLLGWKALTSMQKNKLTKHLTWLVERQFSLRNIFLSVIDFCWQSKIALPSYYLLSNLIANQYNEVEKKVTTHSVERNLAISPILNENALSQCSHTACMLRFAKRIFVQPRQKFARSEF